MCKTYVHTSYFISKVVHPVYIWLTNGDSATRSVSYTCIISHFLNFYTSRVYCNSILLIQFVSRIHHPHTEKWSKCVFYFSIGLGAYSVYLCPVAAPHQGVPGQMPWQKYPRLGSQKGNNKMKYQDSLIVLADATNDLSTPCYEQRTGAATVSGL